MGRFNVAALRAAKLLSDVSKCRDCGKPTIVLNNPQSILTGRNYRPEGVTAETHCACPATAEKCAGPAWRAPGKTDADFLGYGVPDDSTDLSLLAPPPAVDDNGMAYGFGFPPGKHRGKVS